MYGDAMRYTRLSRVLPEIEDSKQFAFYKRFKAAIRGGEVNALPTEGNVEIVRKKTPLTVTDYLIEGDLSQWTARTLQDLNKPRSAARRITVTEDDITSGKVSFSEMVEKYRATLQPKTAKKRERK